MKTLLAALRFLTILPLGSPTGEVEDDLAASPALFPVVGLLLGLIAAAAAWGLSHVAPPLVTAAALVVLLLVFSGCLHIDGLSDTADGFLSSRPRARILEIMKDSHIGVMGVVAVVAVLLVKFAALASLAEKRPHWLWIAALLMPLAGRAAMVLALAVLPCARPEGLASIFYRRRRWPAAAWAASLLGTAAIAVLPWPGLAAWLASMVVTLLAAAYCYRKIGGATGDTFGAVCEIVETVPALTLAVWPLYVAR
jgi:adenosylcobinamide-GDP ribazoletransferase